METPGWGGEEWGIPRQSRIPTFGLKLSEASGLNLPGWASQEKGGIVVRSLWEVSEKRPRSFWEVSGKPLGGASEVSAALGSPGVSGKPRELTAILPS